MENLIAPLQITTRLSIFDMHQPSSNDQDSQSLCYSWLHQQFCNRIKICNRKMEPIVLATQCCIYRINNITSRLWPNRKYRHQKCKQLTEQKIQEIPHCTMWHCALWHKFYFKFDCVRFVFASESKAPYSARPSSFDRRNAFGCARTWAYHHSAPQNAKFPH